MAPDAPTRSKAGGPFINPDPDEIITDLGASHRLLVNKYCIYRPMLVIPTKEYALQTDDLDISDIEATWAVLQAFSTPSLVIYNCGINAGSSQGHKHLQLFPLPAHQLWPSKASSSVGKLFKRYLRRPNPNYPRRCNSFGKRAVQTLRITSSYGFNDRTCLHSIQPSPSAQPQSIEGGCR